jgi:hypothetical protein
MTVAFPASEQPLLTPVCIAVALFVHMNTDLDSHKTRSSILRYRPTSTVFFFSVRERNISQDLSLSAKVVFFTAHGELSHDAW